MKQEENLNTSTNSDKPNTQVDPDTNLMPRRWTPPDQAETDAYIKKTARLHAEEIRRHDEMKRQNRGVQQTHPDRVLTDDEKTRLAQDYMNGAIRKMMGS